jgi:DNA-binding GntR family transcriptional regulator
MPKQNTVFKDAYNRCLKLLVPGESLPSEPELGDLLGVSRTTVRTILFEMVEAGLVDWNRRSKTVRRPPLATDFFPEHETSPLPELIERAVMKRVLAGRPGMPINELELAREIGIGTTSLREFLIRFSRTGLIEKRPNSHWLLRGFTRRFAEDICAVRELFEPRSVAAFAGRPAGDPAWADLAALHEAHRELLADFDDRHAEFPALDDRLHRLIAGASGNRFVADFHEVVAVVLRHCGENADVGQRRTALREHLDLIEALETRRPEAAEAACRRHLATARAWLVQSMPGSRE